ncbi:MAG: 3-hydroxyacyl-[acyl-carrier-protein] dehydratase FabZ [Candidatus Binatia bacterium]|nr:MAG: 3-hydroxyacyl-[acyl-carrier-protein] dehydratase FabZ [Candidatus Binatia bacterium]
MASGFDHRTVQELLPHRYPMLLVDRVVDFDDGARLVGLKNVTANEPYFAGHFPGEPVMPGVLLCEALAQASALLIYRSSRGPEKGRGLVLAALDGVRFRRPVFPGDRLLLEVRLRARRHGVWKTEGRAMVDGKVVAEALVTIVEVARTVPP